MSLKQTAFSVPNIEIMGLAALGHLQDSIHLQQGSVFLTRHSAVWGP